MSILPFILIGLMLLAPLGGCASKRPSEPGSSFGVRGHLIFVPGIDGGGIYDRVFTDALLRGGLDAEVEAFNWCVGQVIFGR